MKKTKLLSLLTAGAVVCTTFGTFAAWDTLETSATQTVVISGQAKIGQATINAFATTSDPSTDDALVYTSSLTVETDTSKIGSLTLTPTVITGGLTEGTDYELEIEEGNTDTTLDAINTYTVKLTAKSANIAGKSVEVKVDVVGTKK